MTRHQLLADDTFNYSFANYQEHQGIGNIRFDKLMPDDARKLERSQEKKWPLSKVARELEVNEAQAAILVRNFRKACEVVDAENPAESFRCAVRHCIEGAVERDLSGEAAIEALVKQICYRASDLSVLLDIEGSTLSKYSRHLRREEGVEYHEDEPDE
jgi:hypothetical protein